MRALPQPDKGKLGTIYSLSSFLYFFHNLNWEKANGFPAKFKNKERMTSIQRCICTVQYNKEKREIQHINFGNEEVNSFYLEIS